MKKIISLVLVLSIALCLCSCGKAKLSISENDKSKKIVEALDVMTIEEVFADIKNIDLYLKPDFDNKDYAIKISEDKKSDTKHINYYSGNTLVYTKYEGYGENGFANYTKTKSGLDATVKYFVENGDHDAVGIYTEKYKVFANILDKADPYGIADTSIIIVSDKSTAPFECSARYYYTNGAATFESATYVEDGNYQCYRLYFYEDNTEDEYTDILVKGEAPETSDDIIKVLQSDKSYSSAAIQISGSNEWYNDGDNWFVKGKLAIVFDNQKQAEEYNKNNNLKGEVADYGSYVIDIDSVTLPISKDAIVENGYFASFITDDIDDSFFRTIILDDNGLITKLDTASISIY